MADQILFTCRDDSFYMHHTRTDAPRADEFTFRSHSHNMYEIYYFLAGDASFAVEGRVHPLQPGTLVITAPGQAHHTLLHGGDAAYERTALLFSQKLLPAGSADTAAALQRGRNVFFLSEAEQIWMLENLRCISSAPSARHRAAAVQMVIAAVLVKAAALMTAAPIPGALGDELVQEILLYIRQHLTDSWDLDTLAQALYRSKACLAQRFRRAMGCSIWEYVVQKRIFAARQQLHLFGSVADAFQASGFQDYSVFYRQYKKIIGLSPSADLREWQAGHGA